MRQEIVSPKIGQHVLAMLFVESDSESVNNTDICQVEDSFTASTTQIAHLSDIFQSLVSINNQAIIRIKETGITIYSSYNHTFNVNVNIDPLLFSIYSITGEEFTLGVDLSLIGECFTSVASTLKFEKSVTCYLNYQGEGSPLVIEFEDTYILEKLEFYTYIIELGMEDDNLGIDYERVEMEAMVRSDVLTNILLDLWQIDTENLFIYAEADTLTFISNGPIGTSKLIFPNDKDVLEKLEISGDKRYVVSQFSYETFYRLFRAVRLSSKCKLIKDAHGCFSIQLLCKKLPLSGYSGTLVTINMMELNHDEFMIGWIEEQEKPVLFTSFKKVEVQSSVVDKRNVSGAVEVPLFL